MRAGSGRLAAVLVLGLATLAPAARAGDIAARITARALPGFSIGHPDQTRFGRLEWIGGFEVESNRREVGGLSGLVVGNGGAHLLAISDDGLMLTAGIDRDGAGRPVGLAKAVIRRLSTDEGPLPVDKHLCDTESVDVFPSATGGLAGVVSFEGHKRVMVGPIGAGGFIGPMTAVAVPKGVRTLQDNRSLEAVAALPAMSGRGDRFVILAEASERQARTDNPPGWVIGGTAPVAFRLHRTDGFDVTDAKVGPDGRLYVLERKFSLLEGIHARIRAVALSDLVEGAVLDGETVFTASMSEQIDNMEGLSIWQRGGETRLSLISDDNRSFLQRTLYLEFRLGPP